MYRYYYEMYTFYPPFLARNKEVALSGKRKRARKTNKVADFGPTTCCFTAVERKDAWFTIIVLKHAHFPVNLWNNFFFEYQRASVAQRFFHFISLWWAKKMHLTISCQGSYKIHEWALPSTNVMFRVNNNKTILIL